ncbi:hypothetical protein [Streptomyces malaysiensis]|uniref:hypothetical protein n=1 Tax=Streptomyces malaysiensis TaxID=92644 RepID=UPI00367AECDD
MSGSRAYWQWTLTLKVDGEDIVIPGSTDAPGNSTKDTILPGILSDIFGDHPQLRGARIAKFTATRIN